MENSSTLLICATRPEWGELRNFDFRPVGLEISLYQSASSPYPLFLCQTGMGWKRAEKVVTRIISQKEFSFERVIHFGLSGALVSELKTGDLVFPTQCVVEDTKYRPIPLVPSSLSFKGRQGVLLTSQNVLVTRKMKSDAAQKYGAIAVDMETYPVISLCLQIGIPFLSLRAIFDPLDWDLTLLDQAQSVDEKGDVHFSRIGRQIMRTPKLLMSLPKYQVALSKANKVLSRGLTQMLAPG